jgi:predicted ester cyclase
MTSSTQIELLNQFAKELNQGNIDSVHKYMSADYFNYSPKEQEPKAHDVYFSILSDIKAAMSDLHIELADLNVEDDLITGIMTITGTTDGPLWGAPATNKSVTWTVNVSIRNVDGRFTLNLDGVTVPELIGTLRQIDMVPPPEKMDRPHIYPVVVPEPILQTLFNGTMAEKECDHLENIKVYETDEGECKQCIAQGDIWPALRMCLVCGFVGCCDTSKNKHMKQHYEDTGHGIFRSIRLDEGWGWCYDDNAFISSRRLKEHYPLND